MENRTNEEIQAIIDNSESKYHLILSGYSYRIGNVNLPNVVGKRNVVAMTGQGGAQLFFKECLRNGMSEDFAISGIEVFTDQWGWVNLCRLKTIENGQREDKETST